MGNRYTRTSVGLGSNPGIKRETNHIRKEEPVLSSPIKRLDQRLQGSPYMEKTPIKPISQGLALSPFNRSRKENTGEEVVGKSGR